MSSRHRFKARAYRPDPNREYQPVFDAVDGMGFSMNILIRAFLRWIAQDPSRIRQLAGLMREVRAETPPGRPRQPRV